MPASRKAKSSKPDRIDAGRRIAVIFAALSCVAAAPGNVRCPPTIVDAIGPHPLGDAAVFDGPPDEMAELVPVPAGPVDRWLLVGVDPYLLCRYRGTTRTEAVHAPGARLCAAGGDPFQATCRR
ncbi:MAG: hypothetical protein INR65_09335 [Gluconacetobacter diazotrophicus]|nr:hypothetical protein [Gluconacetobacter diazotrophicus]